MTVTIAPTSLVDEAAQGANYSSSGTQAVKTAAVTTPIGKVYGTLISDTSASGTTASTSPAVSTTTTPDGSWAFSGIKAPGYYLVTFSKPGYSTAKYIVTTTADGAPVQLAASVAPGNGAISGSVRGPNGPLGGVALTITDGTVTLSTTTPTTGQVGTWGVSGLTTPDTYLVTANLPGYGTQVDIVTLAAGASAANTVLTMTPGVGSLTGTVTSARNGSGVGGITVTATTGTTTLTATTTTTAPIGTYFLPNLAVPGTYAVTVSGPGWVTQTQQVQLSGNAVVNAQVTPSTADVTGVISDTNGVGLPSVGVTLANSTSTFKTLTQSASPVGGYDFGQVPPGQYVLTAAYYGYTTQSAQVSIGPGDLRTVNLSLPFVGAASNNTGSIQGTVTDLFNAKPIGGASLTLDGVATGVTTQVSGDYVIPINGSTGVPPGVHTVTASAPGYESATVRVSVPLGALAFAPPIQLPILDKVGGLVLSNAGGGPVPDPTVELTDPVSGAVLYPNASDPPPAAPTLPGVPSFATGGFELDNINHGNYNLVVSAPGFVTSRPLAVTFPLATNLLFNGPQALTLDREPSFQVVTYLATSSAPPVAQSGVTVTVTDTTDNQVVGTAVSPGGAPPAVTQILPLPPAQPLVVGRTYSASFAYTNGAQSYTAPPITFVGQLNNTAVAAAILALQFPTISVRLAFPYQTPAGTTTCFVQTTAVGACPPVSATPTVAMTGTVGYSSSGGGISGTPVTATVVATGPVGGVWTIPQSATAGFLPSPVTFTVADGTGTFAATTVGADPTGNQFASQVFTLAPTPTQLAQSITTPAAGVTVSVTPASSQQPSGTFAITAAQVNGALAWNDSLLNRPGFAQPGQYQVTYSAAGYDPQTLTVNVGLCAACGVQQLPTVALVPFVSYSVTLTDGVPNGVAGLPGPTATLTNGSTVNQTLTFAGATVTFSNLSVASSVASPLTLTVRESGYGTFTRTGIVLTPGFNGATVTLNQEGTIVGTVSGTINGKSSPLAQATVTAVDTSANPCPALAAAVTAIDGTYTLTGDPNTAHGGLCVGHVYTVAVTPPAGYGNGSSTVTVVAGLNTANFALGAQQLTVTVVAVGSDPAVRLTGVTVSAASAVGAPTAAGPTGGVYDPGTNSITYTLQIDPVPYTFTFNAPGYAQVVVGPLPFSPGVAPQTVTETLTLQKVTINGAVTTPAAAGPVGLDGITVNLYTVDVGNNTTLVAHTTTAADGTYSLSALNDANPALAYIPPGTYELTASEAGYTLASPPVFTTTVPITVVNLQLTANAVPISVTLAATSGVDLTGAIMTLTRIAKPAPAPACPAGTSPLTGLGLGPATQTIQIVGTVGSANSVIPDYYSLLVTKAGLPAQRSVDVAVCPSTAAETLPTYTVSAGQINGVVNVPGTATATQALVVIHTGSASGPAITPNPIITCANSGCSQGTYSLTVPIGSAYTAVATLTGYSAPDATTPTLSSAAPTATLTTTFTATPHSVRVTVTDTTGVMPLPGATVTIGAGGPSGVTDNAGVVTIAGVVPSSTAYTVTAVLGTVTATGTVVVPISDPAGDPIAATATASFGRINGTVTLNPAPATARSVAVSLTCTPASGCGTAAPSAVVPVPVSGSGTIPVTYLPAGSYTSSYSTPGYVTATPGISVASGGTTDASAALAAVSTTITVTVTKANGSAVVGVVPQVTVDGTAVVFPATDATGSSSVTVQQPDPVTVIATVTIAGPPALSGTDTESLAPGTALSVPVVVR